MLTWRLLIIESYISVPSPVWTPPTIANDDTVLPVLGSVLNAGCPASFNTNSASFTALLSSSSTIWILLPSSIWSLSPSSDNSWSSYENICNNVCFDKSALVKLPSTLSVITMIGLNVESIAILLEFSIATSPNTMCPAGWSKSFTTPLHLLIDSPTLTTYECDW